MKKRYPINPDRVSDWVIRCLAGHESVVALAASIGCSRQAIMKWRDKKIEQIDEETLVKMADFSQVKPKVLLADFQIGLPRSLQDIHLRMASALERENPANSAYPAQAEVLYHLMQTMPLPVIEIAVKLGMDRIQSEGVKMAKKVGMVGRLIRQEMSDKGFDLNTQFEEAFREFIINFASTPISEEAAAAEINHIRQVVLGDAPTLRNDLIGFVAFALYAFSGNDRYTTNYLDQLNRAVIPPGGMEECDDCADHEEITGV